MSRLVLVLPYFATLKIANRGRNGGGHEEPPPPSRRERCRTSRFQRARPVSLDAAPSRASMYRGIWRPRHFFYVRPSVGSCREVARPPPPTARAPPSRRRRGCHSDPRASMYTVRGASGGCHASRRDLESRPVRALLGVVARNRPLLGAGAVELVDFSARGPSRASMRTVRGASGGCQASRRDLESRSARALSGAAKSGRTVSRARQRWSRGPEAIPRRRVRRLGPLGV